MNKEASSLDKRSFFYFIFVAHLDYRASFQEQLSNNTGERYILLLCFSSSLILFLSNLPSQVASRLGVITLEPLSGYIASLLFVSVFFTPLILYFLSVVLHLVLRLFGGEGTFYQVRLAFFWSIIVSAPIIVILGIFQGYTIGSVYHYFYDILSDLIMAWILSNIVSIAEKFKSVYPMFGVISFLVLLGNYFYSI